MNPTIVALFVAVLDALAHNEPAGQYSAFVDSVTLSFTLPHKQADSNQYEAVQPRPKFPI